MTNINFFQNLGNCFIFKGNLNRFSFLMLLLIMQIIYIFVCDFAFKQKFLLDFSALYTGILFCYFYGTAISGRLRNMQINPAWTYFIVSFLWVFRFVMANNYDLSRSHRVGLALILMISVFLPLLAKNKKTLLFWK